MGLIRGGGVAWLAKIGFYLSWDAASWHASKAFIKRVDRSPGDGGYLVPDDLRGFAACFSPGATTLNSHPGFSSFSTTTLQGHISNTKDC